MFSKTVARIFLIIIAVAQLLDVLTTNAVLANVPGAIEANPLMASVMTSVGPFWWLPKAVLAAVMLIFAVRLTVARRGILVALGCGAVLYAGVVANNVANLM